MLTISATEDKSLEDYSVIIDAVLLELRKELRSELSKIDSVNWDKVEQTMKSE